MGKSKKNKKGRKKSKLCVKCKKSPRWKRPGKGFQTVCKKCYHKGWKEDNGWKIPNYSNLNYASSNMSKKKKKKKKQKNPRRIKRVHENHLWYGITEVYEFANKLVGEYIVDSQFHAALIEGNICDFIEEKYPYLEFPAFEALVKRNERSRKHPLSEYEINLSYNENLINMNEILNKDTDSISNSDYDQMVFFDPNMMSNAQVIIDTDLLYKLNITSFASTDESSFLEFEEFDDILEKIEKAIDLPYFREIKEQYIQYLEFMKEEYPEEISGFHDNYYNSDGFMIIDDMLLELQSIVGKCLIKTYLSKRQ